MKDHATVIRLRKEGRTIPEIRKATGYGRTTVCTILEAANLSTTDTNAKDPASDRLKSRLKVNPTTGCWEYQGTRVGMGYGQIKLDGKKLCAHRFAYELFIGEKIPPGILVCHKCDNPPCCNPDHLFLGTSPDNSADMVRKGRYAKEKPSIRKFSSDQEREMARLYQVERLSVLRIAEIFGASADGVWSILKRNGVQTRSAGEARRKCEPSQVCDLIQQGLSVKEVAERLGVSPRTVTRTALKA